MAEIMCIHTVVIFVSKLACINVVKKRIKYEIFDT